MFPIITENRGRIFCRILRRKKEMSANGAITLCFTKFGKLSEDDKIITILPTLSNQLSVPNNTPANTKNIGGFPLPKFACKGP